VLEATVDGFGGSVAGAGAVEVGQDVSGALLEGPAELVTSTRAAGTPVLTESMSLTISSRPALRSSCR
jgi:hypothetical protein